jgi:hypothetical protein
MDPFPPWLTRNCLRQAYTSFDLDNPGELPQRPILQVMRIGTSTVTMANRKQATIKYSTRKAGANVDFNAVMAQA